MTAHKQAIASAAYGDTDIATFYREAGYDLIWTGTGPEFEARRAALISALENATAHGLAPGAYNLSALKAEMESAATVRDLGEIEVKLSKVFLAYARDVQTGQVTPNRIDPGIVREIDYRDRAALLKQFAEADPHRFLRDLPPDTAEYVALMKHKLLLEREIERGGWGPKVPAEALKPGQSGGAVILLRNRLMAMGYLGRTASQSYDRNMEQAVQAFQLAHGLEADGVVGPGTMSEINISMEDRLKSVLVAMERERWFNRDRGRRHILVNLTDFHAKIVERGRVVFQTRSVIGKNTGDRRTPEFSDVMEHMVINPSWYVPRSIVTKEYLPKLQRNPNAAGYLEITDSRGRRVNRAAVNFSQYSARTFPFAMRQPPSKSNALGLVKFMFPNKYNIYLHDTPQKHLFARESRAYSHGCIRLADPFDFAYALLSAQETEAKGYFQSILKTGRETKVELVDPVPVHLIYRTAFTSPKGQLQFRRDVYKRDEKIWEALSRAGVALTPVRG